MTTTQYFALLIQRNGFERKQIVDYPMPYLKVPELDHRAQRLLPVEEQAYNQCYFARTFELKDRARDGVLVYREI